MTEDSPNDTRDHSPRSAPLSREEWAYVCQISAHVGSLTPLLMGKEKADYAPYVKLVLAKVQACGLNPERIYRAAAILPPAIAARMPAWNKVRP